MSQVTEPIFLDNTGQLIVEELQNLVNVIGGIPMLTQSEWNALSISEKQSYGLVNIKTADSGFVRGQLVCGADFQFGALRTNYTCPQIVLTNWEVNYSDNFEFIFKHNNTPRYNSDYYSQWPIFLSDSQSISKSMLVQHNFYSNRKVMNFGWNSKWTGDGNISYETPYDYENYYKISKSEDVFKIQKMTSLTGEPTNTWTATLSGASVDSSYSGTLSLFTYNPTGTTAKMDTTLYWFKVYDKNNTLIHDYRALLDSTYNCVLYDTVDDSTLIPTNSGATFVPLN